MTDDPFAAFGDDSDSDGDEIVAGTDQGGLSSNAIALSVAQWCLQQHRQIKLSQIVVGIIYNDISALSLASLEAALQAKGLTNQKRISISETSSARNTRDSEVPEGLCDVLIATSMDASVHSFEDFLSSRLNRGGLLILANEEATNNQMSFSLDKHVWNTDDVSSPSETFTTFTKWPCDIQTQTCPWLPIHSSTLSTERSRVADATVATTVHEQSTKRLSPASLEAAVHKLQTHGYCILPGILDPRVSQQWGDTVLQDLAAAATILETNHGINLLQPHLSTKDPASYRELSMREDLRMDLRHGPALDQLRGPAGCDSWTIASSDPAYTTQSASSDKWFRGHPDLLTIVGRVMNPRNEHLYKGNFGRYNFQGGGPDGSFQNLRVGPIGGIINLPGSADQAIHADTPHLFEHMDKLPAHYINAFTPGCPAHPQVGQTAFVHESHTLEFCAKYMNEDDDTKVETSSSTTTRTKDSWKQFLVRPMLEMGDVVLFDCRILHFGMANAPDTNIQRPLLYTNMTQAWFIDPKNWDNETRIFDDSTTN